MCPTDPDPNSSEAGCRFSNYSLRKLIKSVEDERRPPVVVEELDLT
jgi:hypothetical protein